MSVTVIQTLNSAGTPPPPPPPKKKKKKKKIVIKKKINSIHVCFYRFVAAVTFKFNQISQTAMN